MTDNWLDWAIGGIVALFGWFFKMIFSKITNNEQRITHLEAKAARSEEFRMSIQDRLDRIETKLDRLIERAR